VSAFTELLHKVVAKVSFFSETEQLATAALIEKVETELLEQVEAYVDARLSTVSAVDVSGKAANTASGVAE
jgi:hypothetical protein